MIVSLKPGADSDAVRRELVARGLWVGAIARGSRGAGVHFVTAPHSTAVSREALEHIDGVLDVAEPVSAHPLVDRQGPRVEIGDASVGGGPPVFFCGPCSVESETQIGSLAREL